MIQLPPAGSRLVTINRNFIRRSRWATANTHRTVQLIFFYLKCWCHFGCQMTFLDEIASPSSYPCQSVGQSVSESFIVSDLEIAIASLSFASLLGNKILIIWGFWKSANTSFPTLRVLVSAIDLCAKHTQPLPLDFYQTSS